MSACRSCGADIIWARTADKLIPLDAEARPDGNIELLDDGTAVVHADGQAQLIETARYVTHFASCPQAKEWRR